MTTFARGALVAAAGLLALTTAAVAGVPDPSMSESEDIVVGTVDGSAYGRPGVFGTAAVGDGYVVTVRDINGMAVEGATVTINYTGTGANPYDAQIAPASVNCGTKTVSKVTDVAGQAIFTALFGGFENSQTVEVRANGVLLNLIKARSADLQPAGGDGDVDINDQLLFFIERFGGQGEQADYDLDTDVDISDQLLFFIQRFSPSQPRTPCP